MSEPRERGIVMSAWSVRRMLSGHKRQTRRVVRDCRQFRAWNRKPGDAYGALLADDGKAAAFLVAGDHGFTDWINAPHGRGDRAWVREPWRVANDHPAPAYAIHYPADDEVRPGLGDVFTRTRLARFMPRWAARLALSITELRVQRLSDITEADIIAEGVTVDEIARLTGRPWSSMPTLHDAWRVGWDALNAKRAPAASDPWVWAITFDPVRL